MSHQVVPSGAPILITGSHRSGSTWVANVLARSRSLGYLREPFHPDHRPGICGAEFKHFYTYVGTENEGSYYRDIERMLAFRYNLARELASVRTLRDGLRMVRDEGRFATSRLRRARPLIQAPMGLFMAEWLADRFGARVVVLVRHPAAFAGSLKRLGWTFDFRHLTEQPVLMRRYLRPFEEDVRAYATHPPDVIDQAILIWRMLYSTAARLQEQFPNWIFLRHEDLSIRPIAEFESLCRNLSLTFSQKIRTYLEKTTQASNPDEADDGVVHQLRRDSSANVHNWKKRLTPGEIERIRRGTEVPASHFYDACFW